VAVAYEEKLCSFWASCEEIKKNVLVKFLTENNEVVSFWPEKEDKDLAGQNLFSAVI